MLNQTIRTFLYYFLQFIDLEDLYNYDLFNLIKVFYKKVYNLFLKCQNTKYHFCFNLNEVNFNLDFLVN